MTKKETQSIHAKLDLLVDRVYALETKVATATGFINGAKWVLASIGVLISLGLVKLGFISFGKGIDG